MYSASQIAKYFLVLSDPDEAGDLVSNLKLQKLLYYSQGFHLATGGSRLFSDHIEAWTHGPVVPRIYREYSHYGASAIPRPSDFDPNTIDLETRELLNEVYQVYGQYSAWKLRNMTHEEAPWVEGRKRPDNLITPESLKDYFSTLVE